MCFSSTTASRVCRSTSPPLFDVMFSECVEKSTQGKNPYQIFPKALLFSNEHPSAAAAAFARTPSNPNQLWSEHFPPPLPGSGSPQSLHLLSDTLSFLVNVIFIAGVCCGRFVLNAEVCLCQCYVGCELSGFRGQVMKVMREEELLCVLRLNELFIVTSPF